MTFQYFFFDTYVGYFLEALPITLIVSTIYGFIKYRKDKDTPISKKIFSCLLVCYLTGLLCLTLGLDLMHVIYYKLFYKMDSSVTLSFFNGTFDLVPDFFNNINSEVIGNTLMFLPFGILYPLSNKKVNLKNTIIRGIILVFLIELLEPIFSRSFDINDIILNSIGIIVSSFIYFIFNKIITLRKV